MDDIKCNCYEQLIEEIPIYDKYLGYIGEHETRVYAICRGTREQDRVGCGGDRLSKKCVYYEEHIKKKS